MILIKRLTNSQIPIILFLESISDFEGLANILGLGVNLETLLIFQVSTTSTLKPILGEL